MTHIFGTLVVGRRYVVRPSAYALIENDLGQVAVVLTPQGYFLPGGGLESVESPEEAVDREVLEECGLRVRSASLIAEAVPFAYSEGDDTCYEKRCVFFRAIVEETTTLQAETDHELLWLSPEVAAARMTHESHAWVLREAAQPGVEPIGSRKPS